MYKYLLSLLLLLPTIAFSENPCSIMFPSESVSWGKGAVMLPLNKEFTEYNSETKEIHRLGKGNRRNRLS